VATLVELEVAQKVVTMAAELELKLYVAMARSRASELEEGAEREAEQGVAAVRCPP
jgi:hypothetical protein